MYVEKLFNVHTLLFISFIEKWRRDKHRWTPFTIWGSHPFVIKKTMFYEIDDKRSPVWATFSVRFFIFYIIISMETRLKKLRISGWGESTTRSQTISYKTVLSDIRHAHAESFILIILIIQVVCINFQQNRTYIQHASLGITTPATLHAWYCGTSNTYTSG